ncbi:MAG: hypothetical protein EPGJADBJ_02414 [Saprospiraceae bacterium]|nr:hypothetical protein [Saprospiraceae bacterium]
MNTRKLLTHFSILFLAIIVVDACNYKHYVDHKFRQSYTDVNTAIHNESPKTPFFKIHFKNGDVSILNKWSLNSKKDSIRGEGKLYDFNRHQIKEGQLSFDLSTIAIIETNQLEAIKSKDNEKVTGLAILTAVNVALAVVCLTNPKACFGSCPTFYIDGHSYPNSASAEGFSSSISPALERRDIDALDCSTSARNFSITMKNEALETHMLNELYISAVPRKRNEHVYHDRYGIYYNCGELYNCTNATVDNKDIKYAINRFDENEYFSQTDSSELSSKEEIILEFDRIPDKSMGVVINFRQTLLTTFLLYSGISYMGDEAGDYFAKIETSDRVKKLLANPFTRLGGIKLSVWDDRSKEWVLFEELYETGPIAKNLMLAPLPGIKPGNGRLKIKAEMTKGLWRVDYLGLTSLHSKSEVHIVYPDNIEIAGGSNCSIDKVNSDDDNYLVSLPGDEFRFTFSLPEIEADNEYELFLSSKGYYLEWIRQQWLEGKNLPKLRKMLLNDEDVWHELATEFKSMEHEMETVFWQSKYSKI